MRNPSQKCPLCCEATALFTKSLPLKKNKKKRCWAITIFFCCWKNKKNWKKNKLILVAAQKTLIYAVLTSQNIFNEPVNNFSQRLVGGITPFTRSNKCLSGAYRRFQELIQALRAQLKHIWIWPRGSILSHGSIKLCKKMIQSQISQHERH